MKAYINTDDTILELRTEYGHSTIVVLQDVAPHGKEYRIDIRELFRAVAAARAYLEPEEALK